MSNRKLHDRRFEIRCTADLLVALEKAAEREEASAALIARRAIREHLDRMQSQPVPAKHHEVAA